MKTLSVFQNRQGWLRRSSPFSCSSRQHGLLHSQPAIASPAEAAPQAGG